MDMVEWMEHNWTDLVEAFVKAREEEWEEHCFEAYSEDCAKYADPDGHISEDE